jgi:hypothetical protein
MIANKNKVQIANSAKSCSPPTERERTNRDADSTERSPQSGGCPKCGCTSYDCIDFTFANQCWDCEHVWVPEAFATKRGNKRSGAGNNEVSRGCSEARAKDVETTD